MTKLTSIPTVGVPVKDQERALEFFTATLGLEVRRDVAIPNFGRWLEVAPPGSATTIALFAERDGAPAGVETGIRLTAEDAAAAHADLAAAGVAVEELLRWPGVPPMFRFTDPDGNGFEIVE
jgi:catechol 2,3-dioxygenase-like lactoylglutathione lyase family enzyme